MLIDEIGLAEVSVHNPLKVLHSLLESAEVAVVGLSNWQLDAAKMNRAVHLCRETFHRKELLATAGSVLHEMGLADGTSAFYVDKIVSLYLEVIARLHSALRAGGGAPSSNNLFGLRDFYAIVKYVARECREVVASEPE